MVDERDDDVSNLMMINTNIWPSLGDQQSDHLQSQQQDLLLKYTDHR